MCSDKEKLEIVEDKLHGEYFILTKGKGSFLSFIYLRNIINFEPLLQNILPLAHSLIVLTNVINDLVFCFYGA
jgi:hypothetical protein